MAWNAVVEPLSLLLWPAVACGTQELRAVFSDYWVIGDLAGVPNCDLANSSFLRSACPRSSSFGGGGHVAFVGDVEASSCVAELKRRERRVPPTPRVCMGRRAILASTIVVVDACSASWQLLGSCWVVLLGARAVVLMATAKTAR